MELVRHETCEQYVARRLSEGWGVVSQKGFIVILQSPDGIRRSVDLRNDVETLNPSATGAECNLNNQSGCSACPNHYDCVDEAGAPDDDTTYAFNYGTASNWQRDLYNITNHSVGSGTINKITLHFRVFANSNTGKAKGVIKSGTTASETAEKTPWVDAGGSSSWYSYSQEWATNPDNEPNAWTWDNIDALQIGVNLYATHTSPITFSTRCTQVYIEVDYAIAPTFIPTVMII